MTIDEAHELAKRIAIEELGPLVYFERKPWGHELCLQMPFEYFGSLTVEDLKTRTPEQLESAFRHLCAEVRTFVQAAVRIHSACEEKA